MQFLRSSTTLFAVLALIAGPAFAGFWDEGLTNGAVRTEYGPTFFDTNYGTAADRLVLDFCPFKTGCQIEFPSANAYSDWGGSTASNYWVVILNNEPWHASGTHPDVGPPDAGLPIALPSASQVAGLRVNPGSQTVRLSLDHGEVNPHSAGQGAIPFMAFGADRDRGNGSTILPMNNDPDYVRRVTWQMKIEAANDGFCTSSAPNHVNWAAIQAFSEWNGLKRAFYITLYADGVTRPDTDEDGVVVCSDPTETFLPSGHAPTLVDFENASMNDLWDWPIQRSLYYPGAEFYVLDPAWLSGTCGVSISRHPGVGSTQSYILDVEKVFRCLSALGYWSDIMPSSAPLTGFWWVAELTGQNSRMQYTVTNPRTINAYVGPK